MNKYSKVQQFISVLMIFILLPYLSGCTSTKIISKSDLPVPNSNKYAYVIHSERSKFLLGKSTIANGILSGRINKIYSDKSYDNGNRIHLYLSSDSVIKIEKGEVLSVPLDEVTKVELSEIHGVGTFFIVTGCVALTFVVIFLYGLSQWKFPSIF
jgi:hypothetical protein